MFTAFFGKGQNNSDSVAEIFVLKLHLNSVSVMKYFVGFGVGFFLLLFVGGFGFDFFVNLNHTD